MTVNQQRCHETTLSIGNSKSPSFHLYRTTEIKNEESKRQAGGMNAVCNHLQRRDRIALDINHFLSATSSAIQIPTTFLHFLHGSREKTYLIGKYPERLLKKTFVL